MLTVPSFSPSRDGGGGGVVAKYVSPFAVDDFIINSGILNSTVLSAYVNAFWMSQEFGVLRLNALCAEGFIIVTTGFLLLKYTITQVILILLCWSVIFWQSFICATLHMFVEMYDLFYDLHDCIVILDTATILALLSIVHVQYHYLYKEPPGMQQQQTTTVVLNNGTTQRTTTSTSGTTIRNVALSKVNPNVYYV